MTEQEEKIIVDLITKHKTKYNKIDWVDATTELNEKFPYRTSNGWRHLYSRLRNKQRSSSAVVHELDIVKAKHVIRDRLYAGATITELCKSTGLSELLCFGIIKGLEENDCLTIERQGFDGNAKYKIIRNVYVPPKTYEHYVGKLSTKTFMVISDSHLCSIYEQLSFINFLYDEAQKRGIDTVYHCGDIVDGYYKNRPEQINALHSITFDQQSEYVIKHYPKRDGITTYFITGNHDETHIRNGGADIGKAIARNRDDMIYLGIGSAKIHISQNCWIELLHPLDGSSYATSYAIQKYIDSLSGGEKPNMLFVGHHHKLLSLVNRNIFAYEVPSTCQQSMWEKRVRIQNTSGAWFVTVEIDAEGTLTRVVDEKIIQYKKIDNDYLNFKGKQDETLYIVAMEILKAIH